MAIHLLAQILLSVFAVSLISFVGVTALYLNKSLDELLNYLVSFAVGGLFRRSISGAASGIYWKNAALGHINFARNYFVFYYRDVFPLAPSPHACKVRAQARAPCRLPEFGWRRHSQFY